MSQSPIQKLASAAARRGYGAPVNLQLPKEGTPAVAVEKKAPRLPSARHYRISTYLSDSHGTLMENLITALRKREGRKLRQSEVIERALQALAAAEGLPQS